MPERYFVIRCFVVLAEQFLCNDPPLEQIGVKVVINQPGLKFWLYSNFSG